MAAGKLRPVMLISVVKSAVLQGRDYQEGLGFGENIERITPNSYNF